MKHKLIPTLLVSGLVSSLALSGSPFSLSTSAAGFSDVASGIWYSSYVSYVAEQGLMYGDGDNFQPMSPSDRGTIAYALAALSGETLPTSWNTDFLDVPQDSPYAPSVAWCKEQGVMDGFSTEYFGLTNHLTREQFATALFQFAKITGMDTTAQGNLSDFSDSHSIASWAVDSMNWAVGAGLMKGSNGMLNPGDNVTRAEVAVMLTTYSFLETGSSLPESTPYYEENIPLVYGTVSGASSLRFRAEPNTSCEILTSLAQGTQVKVLGYTSDGWYKGEYEGKTGYLSATYFQVSDQDRSLLPQIHAPFQGYIAGVTQVYQGPGTQYQQVSTLYQPSLVTVTDTKEGWYRMDAGFVPTQAVEVLSASRYRAVWAQINRPTELLSGAALGQQIADYALCFVGYPYQADQSTTDGFDCAGLTKYVYGAFGIELEHSVRSQYLQGVTVEKENLQPGDLLVFGSISHVGIYVGNNKFVHASTSTTGVIQSDITSSYYVKNYVTAKRLV